jgi:acetate kinase
VIVLALNCGSSSLKFQVFASDPGAPAAGARRLARGLVERIGDGATLMFQAEGSSATRACGPVPDHEAAVRRMLGWLAAGGASEHGGALRVDAVGHRVVHGGARFTEPVLIDADVLEAIEALEALAPLHNAPSLAGMRAARAALGPDVPMVAVFDTAFHAAMPEHAYHYAIPHELALKHGIRRYGFHGLAYRSVLARYAELVGIPLERATLVALHLGNGCCIGEHAPEVRGRICAGMEWTGLVLDRSRNASVVGREGRLSPEGARCPAYVIPADEERVIAQDVVEWPARTGASR